MGTTDWPDRIILSSSLPDAVTCGPHPSLTAVDATLEDLVLGRIIHRFRSRRYDAAHARAVAEREARERALAAEFGALRVISLDPR